MRLFIFLFIALTSLTFSSCQKDVSQINDTQLIEAIQNATNKQIIRADYKPRYINLIRLGQMPPLPHIMNLKKVFVLKLS